MVRDEAGKVSRVLMKISHKEFVFYQTVVGDTVKGLTWELILGPRF